MYPTVSQDEAPSSDLVPSESDEINATFAQAARLTGACRVFAPVYRQVTIGALFGTYEADESNRVLADDDVAATSAPFTRFGDHDVRVLRFGPCLTH